MVARLPVIAEAAATPAMKIGAKRILKIRYSGIGHLFEACAKKCEGDFV